jgi:MFS family permease
MTTPLPSLAARPTRVRFGVLAFACSLSMITYLDRVCFGTVAPFIQSEFGLSEKQLGLLFTAFALAYAVFEVPSGWLGDMFGPRKTLIRIVLCWSAFTAMTGLIWPFVADSGWRIPFPGLTEGIPILINGYLLLLSVRFLFGMGEAGAYPNIARAFHNWFPFGERGFAQGAVWMAGRFAGGITALIVLALLTHHPWMKHEPSPADAASAVGLAASGPWGSLAMVSGMTGQVTHWRHAFWIFGLLGVVWCVLFWWWFRDQPSQKSGVNAAELALINDKGEGAAAHSEDSHRNVPWGKLLSSGNLWVLCLMYFCAAYGWYFNITWLPKYLKERFLVTSDTVGFWTFSLMAGAPLLLGSLACLIGGLLTDFFIRRTGNRKWGRRLFGVVGHGLCAACYFGAVFAHSAWMFVLAVAFAAFWNDITMGSAWASCLDIGRRYSGIVSGCMNTIGNLGGAAAGAATGWILDLYGKEVGWTINFTVFGSVYVVATLLWLAFDATRPVAPETTPGPT